MSDKISHIEAAGISRRTMVAAMAATAGAFLIPRPAQAVEATRIATIRRQAAAALGQAYTPKVYTAHEWSTVQQLVNYVIPADASGGSATDAAVPEFMDTMLDLEPQMRTSHRGGLAWLDHECHQRFDLDFVDCSDSQRRQVLDVIAYPGRSKPALALGTNWFNSFRDFTASGYFTSEIGVKYLGYEGNTVVPEWTGCPPENYQRLGVEKP